MMYSGITLVYVCRSSSVFVLLMTRPAPISTLFPTRRSSDLDGVPRRASRHARVLFGRARLELHHEALQAAQAGGRSEEHTSELQSQSNLVCCLLLEKKQY